MNQQTPIQTTSADTAHLVYRPEIDGLRAIAVMAVLIFHLNPAWLPGGFLGVDVFFVVSGYLITSILLRDMKTGRFSVMRFYVRRIRRIAPALVTVVLVCLPLAWLSMDATQLRAFGQSVLAQVLFASNVLFWRTSGYFAAPAETVPLLHTWSLAVEEQFYLLFPLFLALLWRRAGRWAMPTVILLAVASLVAAQAAVYTMTPDTGFYLLPFRSWELLAGSIAAMTDIRGSRQSRPWLAGLGLMLIAASLIVINEGWQHPSIYTLPVIAGACLVLWHGESGPPRRLLSTAPLVGVGLISYSLYLWHWPVLVFAKLWTGSELAPATLVAVAAISLIVAYLSWRMIELPFRRHARFSAVVTFAAAGTLLAGVAGGALLFTVPQWTLQYARMSADQRHIYGFLEANISRTPVYEFGSCFVDRAFDERARTCHTAAPNEVQPSLLLWGDSHAAGLIHGLRQLHPNLGALTSADCGPILRYDRPSVSYCRANNNFVLDEVSRTRPSIVLLAANWREIPHLIPNVRTTIEGVREASPDTVVVVLGSLPQWSPTLPDLLVDGGYDLGAGSRAPRSADNTESIDRQLSEVVHEAGGYFFSVVDNTCNLTGCIAVVPDGSGVAPFAWDSAHLSAGGSLWLSELVLAFALSK